MFVVGMLLYNATNKIQYSQTAQYIKNPRTNSLVVSSFIISFQVVYNLISSERWKTPAHFTVVWSLNIHPLKRQKWVSFSHIRYMAPIVSSVAKCLLNTGNAPRFIRTFHSPNCTTSDNHHVGNKVHSLPTFYYFLLFGRTCKNLQPAHRNIVRKDFRCLVCKEQHACVMNHTQIIQLRVGWFNWRPCFTL